MTHQSRFGFLSRMLPLEDLRHGIDLRVGSRWKLKSFEQSVDRGLMDRKGPLNVSALKVLLKLEERSSLLCEDKSLCDTITFNITKTKKCT